jgi:uncharacterized protein (DUF983 family)
VSGIPCAGCGRFLAAARPVVEQSGEGYAWHEYLADVRGNCKRCGDDVPASRDGDFPWWLQWDAWGFTDEAAS